MPRTPRIVSSAHGPIRRLLLSYPAYAQDRYSYRRVYEDLIRKLPGSTSFLIVTHPTVKDELEGLLSAADALDRSEIVEAPEHLHFLVWAADPYVAVRDETRESSLTYLLEPYTFPRAGDAIVADLLADVPSAGVRNSQSPLYFHGGNVLVGDSFVLLGADHAIETLRLIRDSSHVRVPNGEDPAQFVHGLYKKTFGPDLDIHYVRSRHPIPQYQTRTIGVQGRRWLEELFLGTGRTQPVFHIDMFVSLAGRDEGGRYRVVVGSPLEADRILNRPVTPHALPEIFDDVARNLQRLGFEVIRNPLPIVYVDNMDYRVRTWYFASANNCLVQIADGQRDVWLPTYGHGPWAFLRHTDGANKRIWEDLGFTVHQLADYNPFAQNLGSVHCLTTYLER